MLVSTAVGIAALAIALAARTQLRAASPDVKLVEEKAPDGRACGQWVELTYRACKPVRACNAERVGTDEAAEFADRVLRRPV